VGNGAPGVLAAAIAEALDRLEDRLVGPGAPKIISYVDDQEGGGLAPRNKGE